MEIIIVLSFIVLLTLGIIFLMLGDVTKIIGKIHRTNEEGTEKTVHHVLLEHELGFYNLCYKEACPEKKRELKTLFGEYVQQHRKSRKADDRAMVWAVRKILKGRFNKEAYKKLHDKLIQKETARHANPRLFHHGQF